MPEGFVQVAPDSTGKMLRTRSRTVGTNTVHEQYVITSGSDAVPINRVWSTSLRVPFPQTATAVAAAGTVAIWSCWNGGITNMVSIRRLVCEVDSSTSHAALSPILRLFRMTAQAGTPGNTVITPQAQYTADPAFAAAVAIRANHTGDGAAGTLALGTLATAPLWAQTMPRQVGGTTTNATFYAPTEFNLLPNDSVLMQQDPLILRPSEGCALQMLAPAATPATLGAWNIIVKAVLAEFTYP